MKVSSTAYEIIEKLKSRNIKNEFNFTKKATHNSNSYVKHHKVIHNF